METSAQPSLRKVNSGTSGCANFGQRNFLYTCTNIGLTKLRIYSRQSGANETFILAPKWGTNLGFGMNYITSASSFLQVHFYSLLNFLCRLILSYLDYLDQFYRKNHLCKYQALVSLPSLTVA